MNYVMAHISPMLKRPLRKDDIHTLWKMIENREVFPSMRALMTAGPAADVDNVCMYNCSYVAVEDIRSFSDIMYILCCGTGVGFSCESYHVNKLPDIPEVIESKVSDICCGLSNSVLSVTA